MTTKQVWKSGALTGVVLLGLTTGALFLLAKAVKLVH